MVIARVFGGLGNQLFIYAAARALALRNHTDLVLDTKSGFGEDRLFHRAFLLDHFNVRYVPVSPHNLLLRPALAGRLTRAVVRRVNRALPWPRRFYFTDNATFFDERILFLGSKQKRIYLDGYWQNEAYFHDHATTLRDELTLTTEPTGISMSLAKKMASCDSVAVHYRTLVGKRNDKRNIGRLPRPYYESCFRALRARLTNPHLFLFADSDSAFDQPFTAGLPYTCVTHNHSADRPYEDLWLMSQCKHHIIANSTFSWWGAWLCNNQAKFVFAPELAPTPCELPELLPRWTQTIPWPTR
jgi:hypothetical protein